MNFSFGNWIKDLQRRHVFRVAAIYAAIAWAVVEVTDVVVPATGMPPWVLTAVVVFAMLGFPVAVVLAWVFDVGEEGLVRTEPGSAKGLTTIAVSLGVLVVATAGMVWLLLPGLDESESPTVAEPMVTDNSLAVLPFANMSGNPDNEYFSDGLTDTLLHMLAGESQLRVAARTSSFAFKGQDQDIRTIAKAIGVSHVLEGSVQRDAERIRVTAQLVRADDGFRIWSRSFDSVLEDIFEIQDEIAGEVATELAASMLEPGVELHPANVQTTNVDAYDLFLRGRELRIGANVDDLIDAEQLLKQALVLDPGFLDAKLELALNLFIRGGYTTGDLGLADQAVAQVEQILDVDPDNARARMIRIVDRMSRDIFSGNSSGWIADMEKLEAILDTSPGDGDLKFIVAKMQAIGPVRDERGIELFEELLVDDPLNVELHVGIAQGHRALGNIPEAREAVDRALELDPDTPDALNTAAMLDRMEGDGVGYIQNMMRASAIDPLDPGKHANTALFLYSFGMVAEGDRFRDRLLSIAPGLPISHFVMLKRAVATDDAEAVYRLVGERLRAGSGESCCLFTDGVEFLIRQAARDDRMAETVAVLDQHRPGFSDLTRMDMPTDMLIVRVRQIHALRGDRSDAEVDAFVDRMNDWAKPFSPTGIYSPRVHSGILAMNGDLDQAADVVLEGILGGAMINFMDWKPFFAQPVFEEVVAMPRVREALDRWREEERQLQVAVRAMFDDSGS